jgi:hypothetical protein
MERRLIATIVILLGILATPLYAQRPRDVDVDRPHDRDCIRAAIFRNPDVLVAGDHFVMVVGIQNRCRHIALVNVDIYLARDNFRVQIGAGQVLLDGPEAEMLYLRPLVPRRIRSGRYSLVMVARERGGSAELDRTAVFVRHQDRRRPDDRPNHLDSMVDGGTMDGLEGTPAATGPRSFSGEATGKITHLNSTEIKVEQEVGPTTPFLTIDAATLIVDEQGKPTNVNSTDLVTVYYTDTHADKIVVLDK